jgi:hypothetical protein
MIFVMSIPAIAQGQPTVSDFAPEMPAYPHPLCRAFFPSVSGSFEHG